MKLLENAILEKGRILGNSILKVDTIINHQIDPILMNQIGEELAEIYQVPWLPSDFKKKEGYKKSVELSNEYGLYRQDYCGCAYSKVERER